MREIVSPLDGIRSPFGVRSSVSPLAIYAVLGFTPELVLDFDDEKYFANSSRTTFSDAITHSASSNATMVDSDGLLKWRPHNLVTYSEDLTQAWSVFGPATIDDAFTVSLSGSCAVSSALATTQVGAGYTVVAELWTETDVGEQVDIGFNTNNLSNTFSAPITLTATPTTYSFSKSNNTATQNGFRLRNVGGTDKTIKMSKVRLYRSDLGGMVNNPDRNDSYVPTTSSAVYLPRRGHHVYNGTSWVNEGLLHESEARTNLLHTTDALVTQSLTVTAVPHTLHFTGTGTVTLSGASTAGPLVGTGTGENNRVSLTFTPTAASLTLTVTGTVTNAQLEVGSTPSSYIPNLAASGSVTRAAETLTIPSAKLPWPTPNVIGPELVTNGTFDTDTDWTKGTGWTIGSGVATHVAGAAGGLDQSGILTPTKVYQVTGTATASGGTWALQFIGGSTTTVASGLGSGAFSFVGVAGAGNTGLRIFAGTSTDLTIDNISVREIDPLAVSIQMQGRATYADNNASIEATFVRWTIDSNNRIEHRLDTNSVNTGLVTFLQTASGVTDLVSSSGTAYSPGINVPFNIASRHGSTFINGSVDGTALTADTTPTALPDLSATDLNLGFDYMGTIKMLRIWADDLGDTGIAEAST